MESGYNESCKGLAEERNYVKSLEEFPCRKSQAVLKPPKKVRRGIFASVRKSVFFRKRGIFFKYPHQVTSKFDKSPDGL